MYGLRKNSVNIENNNGITSYLVCFLFIKKIIIPNIEVNIISNIYNPI